MERARRRPHARLLERVRVGASTTTTSPPPSCRTLAEHAAEHGIRIAYEALAWGRHVSDYEHAWRIVARSRSPQPRHLPGLVPHPLARQRPRAASATSPARRSSTSSSPTRRELAMDVLQWSRHYRCFPGQGGFDLAGVRAARARDRVRRPALARGVQRRLPPGRPAAHGGRRDALAAAARGGRGRDAAAAGRAAARVRLRRAGRAPRRRPAGRAAADRDGLPPRRPAPHQAGAAVAPRRHAHPRQPRAARRARAWRRSRSRARTRSAPPSARSTCSPRCSRASAGRGRRSCPPSPRPTARRCSSAAPTPPGG